MRQNRPTPSRAWPPAAGAETKLVDRVCKPRSLPAVDGLSMAISEQTSTPALERTPVPGSRYDGQATAATAATPTRAAVHTRMRRASRLRRRLALGDAGSILVAFMVSFLVFGHHFHMVRDVIVAGASLPAWILLLKLYGLYDADGKRISHCTVDDLPGCFTP